MEVTQRTSIIVSPETRKLLQLRKQERGLQNVDEVIIQALKLSGSGSKTAKPGDVGPAIISTKEKRQKR